MQLKIDETYGHVYTTWYFWSLIIRQNANLVYYTLLNINIAAINTEKTVNIQRYTAAEHM